MSPNLQNKVPTFFGKSASIDYYFLRHKTLNPTFLGKSHTLLQLISTKEIRSDEIMKHPKPKINLIYNSFSKELGLVLVVIGLKLVAQVDDDH
jgi:hypothetical protein